MNNNQATIICTSLDRNECAELQAFSEAIKNPETRKEIISILEEAGLLPA